MTDEELDRMAGDAAATGSVVSGGVSAEASGRLAAHVHALVAEVRRLRAETRLGRRQCPDCGGDGHYPHPGNPDPEGRCPACRGTGYYLVAIPAPPGESVAPGVALYGDPPAKEADTGQPGGGG